MVIAYPFIFSKRALPKALLGTENDPGCVTVDKLGCLTVDKNLVQSPKVPENQ